MLRTKWFVATLFALSLALSVAGRSHAVDIVGTVSETNTGVPLSNCTVILYELSLTTHSDMSGGFQFLGIPDGVYTFMVGCDNHSPVMIPNFSTTASCCVGRVGDANNQGGDEPTIGDVSVLIDAKFISGYCDGIIVCFTEADVNQSATAAPGCDDITIGDISILIDYLFITGPTLGLPDCL